MLEIRKVNVLVKDLEKEASGDNIVSESIDLLDTITDKYLVDKIYASNGFDLDGRLNHITYRGYDVAKKCLFVLTGHKELAEEVK